MKYNHLFQPLSIGGLELRNRICMTAIHLNYCDETKGYPSEKFKEFYYRRAEGGAALVTVGGCRFSAEGAVGAGFMSLEDDSYIEPWKEFAQAMHKRGAKVAVQLYHAGRYSRSARMPEGMQALAPSAVFTTFTHETPKEMTLEEIKMVIDRQREGARRVKEAGFDAVEVLGSAGYLITQFLSPVTNLRTDEYGGSYENRCRFPREIMAAVREGVGPDFPIIVRMAGNDFIPGSNTNVEAAQFAKMYEECGANILSVTGGWHETRVPQLPGEVPHGGYAYLARAIKAAVSIPVIAANRIQDPFVAEEILATGEADCVGMCRTLLADPEWPNKAMAHQEDEIRRCVGCNQGCLAATFFGKQVGCLVNSMCGREDTVQLSPAAEAKNVLVIGGGPAGMEFALRAAERGHAVSLWEKNKSLGGQLELVAAPPGKEDFKSLVHYYEVVLKKAGVEVICGKEATLDEVKFGGFDEIIVATGAVPRTISVENPGNIPVVTAFDVLGSEVIPGKNVVVVGGGAIGCETAQLLAHRSAISPDELFFLSIHKAENPERIQELVNRSWRTINIVEIAPKLGSGFDAGCAWPVLKDLNRLAVGQYANAQIVSTTENSATISYKNKEGTALQVELPCDTIVLCVGSLPEHTLYDQLIQAGCKAQLIGDGRKVGRVLDAVHEAIDTVYAM